MNLSPHHTEDTEDFGSFWEEAESARFTSDRVDRIKSICAKTGRCLLVASVLAAGAFTVRYLAAGFSDISTERIEDVDFVDVLLTEERNCDTYTINESEAQLYMRCLGGSPND